MNRQHTLHALMVLVGVLGLAVLSAGCTTPSQAPSSTTTGPAASSPGTQGPDVVSGVVGDWVGSKHADVVSVDEVFCKACHDGAVYAASPKPAPAFPVATDCRVCHTGKGQAIRMAGQVSLSATSAPVTGVGQGAVCMSCHTNISAPTPNDPKRGAPHNNPAADVLLAFGGIRSAGGAYGSTVKHATQPDSCVTCHMQKNAQGVPTHTFKVLGVGVCTPCHPGISGPDLQAKADFDGNGQVQGLQEEVKGLDKKLRDALAAQTNGGSVEDFQGNIVFVGKTTTMTASAFSGKVYNAGYNVILVEKDKSWGVHNPQFVVNLLQQSYKDLTGSSIPGATPFN